MRYLSELTKIPTNARFATLARALADTIARAEDPETILGELARLREQEHKPAEELAGIARQIGDAARNAERIPSALLERLQRARSRELLGI